MAQLGHQGPRQDSQKLLWQPFTVSKDDMLMSSFRHSTLFLVSPIFSLVYLLFIQLQPNCNSIQKQGNSKFFYSSIVPPLIFPFIYCSYYSHTNHSLKCFLNSCLIFNVSMHASFSRLDHEIPEDKDILYLNCSASILTNNE